MADTTAPATDVANKRPEKPDEAKFKADVAEAEKKHKAAQDKFQSAKQKFDNAIGAGKRDPNDRYSQLIKELQEIRAKQGENKSAKSAQQATFDRNDAEIKRLISEQKEARGRAGFKDAKEIDAKIDSIQQQVDSGKMKVVEEKKALEQISQLKRQKKGFSSLDDMQKQIDAKKAENAELRKTFDNPEYRALKQKYDDNQKELDQLKAAREGDRKNADALKKDREAAYAAQQEAWTNIRTIKDEHYANKRAYKAWEDQYYAQVRERKVAERKAYESEKRQRIAKDRLEEASGPAFSDEIRTAEGLIKHFDPSRLSTETETGPGKYAASAQRTVDDSSFKGMKVVKKDEEDFFVGGAGKKKGKGKRGAAAAESTKLNMNIGIIEELAKVGVDPPSTQDDIPGVVSKLEEKVAYWKKNQKEQTEKNIEKAKKEIEKLEKEADEAAAAAPAASGRRDRGKKTAQASAEPTAEAQQEQEKDAAADVSKEMEAATIEDKTTPDVASA